MFAQTFILNYIQWFLNSKCITEGLSEESRKAGLIKVKWV